MTGLFRATLHTYLDTLLQPEQFQDYCPNGLQVEGKCLIQRLMTGVTASLALLEAARDWHADALLVHHGYFWRNESPCIVNIKHRRLQCLLQDDINLFAYHLPLDAHPTLGNNAQWAEQLGLFSNDTRFGRDCLGWLGHIDHPAIDTLGDLAEHIERITRRRPLLIGDSTKVLHCKDVIAWCTGAAQGYFSDAIAMNAKVYISGEISESTVHLARESGVAYIAAGHHATERYGVAAVGKHVAEAFNIEHQFVDIENPV